MRRWLTTSLTRTRDDRRDIRHDSSLRRSCSALSRFYCRNNSRASMLPGICRGEVGGEADDEIEGDAEHVDTLVKREGEIGRQQGKFEKEGAAQRGKQSGAATRRQGHAYHAEQDERPP